MAVYDINRILVPDAPPEYEDHNLLRLRGIDERHAERHEVLEGIADGSTPLKVNVELRLVVFGFDADQRDGENWRPHCDKLKDRLGNRVIFRGSSKGLTRGISA